MVSKFLISSFWQQSQNLFLGPHRNQAIESKASVAAEQREYASPWESKILVNKTLHLTVS